MPMKLDYGVKPFNEKNDFDSKSPTGRTQIMYEALVPFGLYRPLEDRLKTFANNFQSKNPGDRGGSL